MFVKVYEFDLDFFVFFDYIGDFGDFFWSQLGDVNQIIFGVEEVYECVEVDVFYDCVFIDYIYFWFGCDGVDLVDGCFDGFIVG